MGGAAGLLLDRQKKGGGPTEQGARVRDGNKGQGQAQERGAARDP